MSFWKKKNTSVSNTNSIPPTQRPPIGGDSGRHVYAKANSCVSCGAEDSVTNKLSQITSGGKEFWVCANCRLQASQIETIFESDAHGVARNNLTDLTEFVSRLDDVNAIVSPYIGYTSLHMAARSGNLDYLHAVLQYRPNLELHSRNSQDTPLHTAVAFNHPEAVQLLLAAGAKVDATSHDGLTSLHYASMRGFAPIIRLLLDRGADFNALEANRATPLHAAAYYGHTESVQELLRAGADRNLQDQDGLTPDILARRGNHHDIVSLFEATLDSTQGDASSDLHQAVRNHDLEAVKALLRENPDLVFTKEDYEGRTALHEADTSDIATVLLAEYAEVDARDKEGKTPLHIAAYGNGDVAKVLLANKANANAADNEGRTPLHHAAIANNKEVASLLLANGAEINATKNDGKTPLSLAVQYEHAKDVAEFLRRHGGDEWDELPFNELRS